MNIEEFEKWVEVNLSVTDKRGNVAPFKLFESQKILARAIITTLNNPVKRGVLVAVNRQIGSSSLVHAIALYHAATTADANVVIGRQNQELAMWRQVSRVDSRLIHSIRFVTQNIVSRLNGETTPISLAVMEDGSGWSKSNTQTFLDICKCPVIITMLPGTETLAHQLWIDADSAWDRCFIPWYAEKIRVLTPPARWKPQEYESKMAARVQAESGVELSNAQLYWYERKRENASMNGVSLRILDQELATTFHGGLTE